MKPVTVTKDIMQKVLLGLAGLQKSDVLIGIPEDASSRKDNETTNSEIGFTNEFGSPVKHIPARPHLIPGVENSKVETIPIMQKAILAALDGKQGTAETALEQAGQIASDYVKEKITDGPFTPLSPVTIAMRAARGRKHAKMALRLMAQNKEVPADFVKPLIDTGEYRRAHTYIVRKK